MGRGEYVFSSIGSNGVRALPGATGYVRSYADVFRERVAELDAAIQQADRDYTATYSTNWQSGYGKPGEPGLDQSVVIKHWRPFVQNWNGTREWLLKRLLAGQIDRGDALVLATWAGRFNDFKMSAAASMGLYTTAPNVTIRGEADAEQGKTPRWKIAAGVAAALGVGYFVLVRPSIKAGDRRLAEARKLASDVGLRSGMTEDEKDRAFDAYYKKKGYPSYLLSTARKVTT